MSRLVLPTILGGLLSAGAPLSAGAAQARPFDELVREADAARLAGRLGDASALYRQAVAERPRWAEGFWYLGTMAYDGDRPLECLSAFESFLALKPDVPAARALHGLCAFQLARYATARSDLQAAVARGPLADEGMGKVVVYHRALLEIRAGAFEVAILPLTQLLQVEATTPELADACGLLLLRRARLPSEIPPGERERVRAVGEAYCAHLARRAEEAQRLFAELLARYPRQRYLHYGYGLSLAQEGKVESLAQFEREIELHPDDLLARVELAFGLVARGRAAEALAPAAKAVALAPGLFATHLALGRALVEAGELDRGIGELERAAQLEPGIVEIHWALATAYARAGRAADAARARARVQELEAARRPREPGKPSEP